MAPTSAAERERAAQAGHFYGEHFEATWKLEYFVDVALGRRPPHPSISEVMLGETGSLPGIDDDNPILWGSAATPFGNALYIPGRIDDIHRAVRQATGPSLNQPRERGSAD